MMDKCIVPVRRTEPERAMGLLLYGWRGEGAWAWAAPGQPCNQVLDCRCTLDRDDAPTQVQCRWGDRAGFQY